MDESKPLEEIRNWEHPPWYGNVHFEEKVTQIFLENQRGLFHHFITHFRMPVKRWIIFGPFQETSYTAITLNPESNFYSPREESFPIPLKYIDVSRTTHTNLDVLQERRIDDYWNIDGSRDLSDSWTGFTQFISLEEKASYGYMWSGVRLTKRQVTSRPDHLWPELWEKLGRKNKKLETPMAPAMPCKASKKEKHGATRGKTNELKSKLACILEASKSTRLRMGESLPNHHEDHIAGKGDNSTATL